MLAPGVRSYDIHDENLTVESGSDSLYVECGSVPEIASHSHSHAGAHMWAPKLTSGTHSF